MSRAPRPPARAPGGVARPTSAHCTKEGGRRAGRRGACRHERAARGIPGGTWDPGCPPHAAPRLVAGPVGPVPKLSLPTPTRAAGRRAGSLGSERESHSIGGSELPPHSPRTALLALSFFYRFSMVKSSRYRGVTLFRPTGKWRAQISSGGKTTSLGCVLPRNGMRARPAARASCGLRLGPGFVSGSLMRTWHKILNILSESPECHDKNAI